MRIINRHIAHDFLVTFSLSLLVFTFVMCVGAVIKAIDLLARGVSGMIILQVFSYNIPFLLTFSIPISTLTAALLIFGRMSFDGEITAMRACGLSLWQIVSPVVILSIALSALCVYLNGTLAPQSHFAQRKLLINLGMEEPVNLLEEGRFVRDFPGMMIYVAKKDRKQVYDVVVYQMDEEGVVRNVRAKTGTLRADKAANALFIDLYDVRIDQPDKNDPLDPTKSRYLNAKHYPVKLDFTELMKKGSINKKVPDMTYAEVIAAVRDVRTAFPNLKSEDVVQQRMKLMVDANERLALSLSCLAFVLIGMPLGLKSRRKESSIGVGISLMLVFMFYFFIILADSLVGHPEMRPDLIVWFPVFLAEILGFYLIQRSN